MNLTTIQLSSTVLEAVKGTSNSTKTVPVNLVDTIKGIRKDYFIYNLLTEEGMILEYGNKQEYILKRKDVYDRVNDLIKFDKEIEECWDSYNKTKSVSNGFFKAPNGKVYEDYEQMIYDN